MSIEKTYYVVAVDAGSGRELSPRVPIKLTGGVAGHWRHLAEPVALPINRPGFAVIKLYDAASGGTEITFTLSGGRVEHVVPSDIYHVS